MLLESTLGKLISALLTLIPWDPGTEVETRLPTAVTTKWIRWSKCYRYLGQPVTKDKSTDTQISDNPYLKDISGQIKCRILRCNNTVLFKWRWRWDKKRGFSKEGNIKSTNVLGLLVSLMVIRLLMKYLKEIIWRTHNLPVIDRFKEKYKPR